MRSNAGTGPGPNSFLRNLLLQYSRSIIDTVKPSIHSHVGLDIVQLAQSGNPFAKTYAKSPHHHSQQSIFSMMPLPRADLNLHFPASPTKRAYLRKRHDVFTLIPNRYTQLTLHNIPALSITSNRLDSCGLTTQLF